MLNLKSYFLDILFPRHCLGCQVLLKNDHRSYVCRICLKSISFVNGFACAFCGSPVKNGKTCAYCIRTHYLDRLLASTTYENKLTEKITKTMKYRFVESLASEMASVMTKYLEKKVTWIQELSPVVVPVPLHNFRLNWRGFNQSEIIAQKIGNDFGWPVLTSTLKRLHDRKPQADMPDRLSRIENARNLFQISGDRKTRDLANKTVLLIDDISTTGSTLNDCARALKGAGAKEVIGFVFARGKLDKR